MSSSLDDFINAYQQITKITPHVKRTTREVTRHFIAGRMDADAQQQFHHHAYQVGIWHAPQRPSAAQMKVVQAAVLMEAQNIHEYMMYGRYPDNLPGAHEYAACEALKEITCRSQLSPNAGAVFGAYTQTMGYLVQCQKQLIQAVAPGDMQSSLDAYWQTTAASSLPRLIQ